MFEDMVVSTSKAVKTNKPWTVMLSMIFQVSFLAVLILIPLIYTEALPKTMMATLLVESPLAFRRRLIFISANALSRPQRVDADGGQRSK